MTFSHDIMQQTKAWPFEQARDLVKRLMILEKRGTPHPATLGQGPVIFQTDMVRLVCHILAPLAKWRVHLWYVRLSLH